MNKNNNQSAAWFYNLHANLNESSVLNPDFGTLFSVESVESCVKMLKLGKASGPDELSSEHITYAHPSLVLHSTHSFRFRCLHGAVPHEFGAGICIPLFKDKLGDINDINNKGITLILPSLSCLNWYSCIYAINFRKLYSL